MRIAMLTREWPPDIYGGAGVHVEQLVEHLSPLAAVNVQCFGAPRPDAQAHEVPRYLDSANPALQTLGIDLGMAAAVDPSTDVVHSHTWYANLAGHLASLLNGVPHVVTAHSLEPMRPWKREQLGGGYEVSSWVEQTVYLNCDAIIAVSEGMRRDIATAYPQVDPAKIHVVHNGIDTFEYQPTEDDAALNSFGIAGDRPYALFVGRITRQKGLLHLLRAARSFDDDVDLVLCASSPDTPEIAVEVSEAIADLQARRRPGSIVWIDRQVDRRSLIELLSHARVFTCPSIYEPLGIVNLEAMACQTAVVASAVGGIPEVVQNGVTGTLVPYDPQLPEQFERDFAAAVNAVARNETLAREFGREGRRRAVTHFSWTSIAEQTLAVYRWAIERRATA